MQHLPVGAEDARRPALLAQVYVRGMRGAIRVQLFRTSVSHMQGHKPRAGPCLGVEDIGGQHAGNMVQHFTLIISLWTCPEVYYTQRAGVVYVVVFIR